jgi:hypothetical protein
VATYTYLLADLRTNAILAELPLRPSSINTKLSGHGELRATLALNAKGMSSLDLPALLADGASRNALYVDRDGVLVWGGILWSGGRKHAEHQAELQFLEFESYLQTRLILTDYKPANADQLVIARTLVNTMQAKVGGNIGIVVGTETSGVLRTRDHFRTSLQTVGEALRSLVELEHGFDCYISVAYDSNGVPAKTLRLGYPQIGRGASVSGLDFQLPGNITEWADDWNAFADSATDYYELGQGEGSSVLIGSASDPARITAGYPVMERKSSLHRDVSSQTELNAHAREDLAAAHIPVKTYSCQVMAGADPVLGSYIPGDAARFRVSDDWYQPADDGTPTFDTYLRILGFGIEPETDRVNLTLGAAR